MAGCVSWRFKVGQCKGEEKVIWPVFAGLLRCREKLKNGLTSTRWKNGRIKIEKTEIASKIA